MFLFFFSVVVVRQLLFSKLLFKRFAKFSSIYLLTLSLSRSRFRPQRNYQKHPTRAINNFEKNFLTDLVRISNKWMSGSNFKYIFILSLNSGRLRRRRSRWPRDQHHSRADLWYFANILRCGLSMYLFITYLGKSFEKIWSLFWCV